MGPASSGRGPLLQHSRALPDRQPRLWSFPNKPFKNALSFGEAISGEQQFGDALPIPAPFLDLVEVASVGEAGVVGFFVGPIPVGHFSYR
jgi:hypothetical protein